MSISKDKVIEYPDGRKYVGELFDGKPDGKGSLYFPNGAIYNGCFMCGEMHGRGEFVFPNKVKRFGYWVMGTPKFTALEFPNGDYYEGNLNGYNRDGYGIYKYNNGDIYRGNWRDGKKFGYGKMNYSSQNGYLGSFYDNKKKWLWFGNNT